MKKILVLVCSFFIITNIFSQSSVVKVTAKNELAIGRMNQTIEVPLSQLKFAGWNNMANLHVKSDAGRELVFQLVSGSAIDSKLIFQSDFGPNEELVFYVSKGTPHFYPTSAYKTYGRFVRERFDDFAWENDRIAMRSYGPALRNANPGALTSSAVDIWSKKTDKLIINEWYMKNHYHNDSGEGADLYQSGTSRGVGGDGIWANEKLWVATNYTNSKVFSSGPLRICFQLDHDPYQADNVTISETRFISLDAGQNLNHFIVKYDNPLPKNFLAAAGIQKTDFSIDEIRKGIDLSNIYRSKERKPSKILQKDIDEKAGWITTEQALSEGYLYSAVIIDSSEFRKAVTDDSNELLLAQPQGKEFSYWSGFAWSESGQFKDYEDWVKYVRQFAKELQSPIRLKVAPSNNFGN